MATTARQVTTALRALWPAPVRLTVTTAGDAFLVALPATPAAQWRNAAGSYAWMEGFLGRRLGAPVTIARNRVISRRDCSKDVEFRVTVA
jgi:hypothetical protein